MGIFISALIFTAGIILVVKGGDIFVDAATWIAHAAGIPTFIIGATIVSLATTMPEMIVSCLAAAQGKVDMAIGNAVGSVTANTGLIMALAFIFMIVIINRADYIKQCVMLVACSVILLAGSQHGQLSNIASLLLVTIFTGFMALNVYQAKNSNTQNSAGKKQIAKNEIVKNILNFTVGIAMIVGGSQLLINGGAQLAQAFGVPERIIAVTFVAIGTSLPELITTITAIRKHESALSVGNIIGANVIDLSLILPVSSLIAGKALPVSEMVLKFDFTACLAVLLTALVPLLIREKASRFHGIILLAAYMVYIAVTV